MFFSINKAKIKNDSLSYGKLLVLCQDNCRFLEVARLSVHESLFANIVNLLTVFGISRTLPYHYKASPQYLLLTKEYLDGIGNYCSGEITLVLRTLISQCPQP